MFNTKIQAAIADHANRVAPAEACGFVLNNGTVMACKNSADDPENHFKISAIATGRAKKRGIAAVYHSHVNGLRGFSPDDIRSSRALGIPFYLYHQRHPEFWTFDPNTIAPYEGREFHFAYQNCYELVRDWYEQELGIELEHKYPDRAGVWDEPEFDPIALIDPVGQGFVALEWNTSLQNHDVVVMQIGRQRRGCHLGVITDADRNHFLHHLTGQLSRIDVYGGDWAAATTSTWRHRSRC